MGKGTEAMTNTVTLTDRQLQVLKLTAEGYSYKDMAEEMKVSPSSVNAIRSAIIEKLAATNITHAVVKAIKLGVLDIEHLDV